MSRVDDLRVFRERLRDAERGWRLRPWRPLPSWIRADRQRAADRAALITQEVEHGR